MAVGFYLLTSYAITGFKSFSDRASDVFPVRVIAPGVHEIALAPGKYTIFHEYESYLDGNLYSADKDYHGFRFSLVSKDSGQVITISPPSGSTNYSFNGVKGVSVKQFEIDESGEYLFTVTMGRGKYLDKTVISIGAGLFAFITRTMFDIVAGIAILGGSVVACLIAMIIVYNKRRASAVPDETRSRLDKARPIHPE